MIDTPTLDKIEKVAVESQCIGEFLDWLNSRGILLAEQHIHSDGCYEEYEDDDSDKRRVCGYVAGALEPLWVDIEKLIATFFDIDLGEAERERRKLLESVRERTEEMEK